MPYNSSNFLGTYLSTSKTLRILNSSNQVVFTLAVCNYQKSSVSANNLNIVLEDNTTQYSLDFSSSSDAFQALVVLKTAIDTLKLNCNPTPSGGGGGSPITAIPITYVNFKSLQVSNNLLPFQWYDVVDSTGLVLPASTTMRLLTVSTNDFHPTGEILDASQAKISIDSITDDVLYYEKPDNRITLINSKVLDQAIDSSSNNILVKNKSKLTSTNSQIIEIGNNSIVAVSGCNNIKISNSTVNILSANNLIIDNFSQDLSTLPFNLSNVEINNYDSIGKQGETIINNNKTLEAYFDVVYEIFSITSNNNNFIVLLSNRLPSANAEFNIKYNTISNTGNTIAVKNTNNSLLFTLTDAQIGSWVKFKWNISTALYEFVAIQYGGGINGFPYRVSPVTNNQTTFPLPVPSTSPTKIEMYINGQKKLYGLDYSYSSGIQSVIYTNRDFTIASTDEVEFVIY